MAAQTQAVQFHDVQICKTRSLGLGSYGAVYRAKADRLPCAAKILHPILFRDGDPGARRIQQHFEQECQFLSGIRHPNIVQYLGMCRDHASGHPALLMELMDESLTHFLENSQEPLPYHLEVNLSHDIALALDYLHSHGIVHRDLSSNNVLLIAGSRAKVTDFGMSKVLDTALHMTPQTQCPGTVAYMSPEALRTPPEYTKKLDCFSFGVLCIQIMTRQFPDPGPARQVVEDPRSPVGTMEMPVPERERRKPHIDLITPNRPLLLTALRCLEYHERNRPSAQELCDQMATLKEDPQYTQSVQQAQERGRGGTSATADVAANDEQIAELQRRLVEHDQHIQDLQQQLQDKDVVLEQQRLQLQQLQETASLSETRERQLQDQLQANEQVTAELQRNLLRNEGKIRDLQESLLAKDERIRQLEEQQTPNQWLHSSTTAVITSLRWKEATKAPENLHGSATANGTLVYFRNIQRMYAYNSGRDDWRKLPHCPNADSSLVVVNTLLTAVGGINRAGLTNSLVSLTGEGRQRKWSYHFPSMPTKRRYLAVVCSGRSLVAAGGHGDKGGLSTVEVMCTDALQWSTASSLPHPFWGISATICGDNLYLLGGNDNSGPTKSVLTCSLTAILESCQLQSPGEQPRTALSEASGGWQEVAESPLFRSTSATLRGQLLAVGGRDSNFEDSTDVHVYNPTNSSWDNISHTPVADSTPLVAPLPGDKLMVVCGQTVSIASVGL